MCLLSYGEELSWGRRRPSQGSSGASKESFSLLTSLRQNPQRPLACSLRPPTTQSVAATSQSPVISGCRTLRSRGRLPIGRQRQKPPKSGGADRKKTSPPRPLLPALDGATSKPLAFYFVGKVYCAAEMCCLYAFVPPQYSLKPNSIYFSASSFFLRLQLPLSLIYVAKSW